MFIGATGQGKSALVQALDGKRSSTLCLQEVVYGERTIDIPGGYLEHPWMVKSLIAIAQNNASHVVFVVEEDSNLSVGSPGLGNVFTCPVIGVVTATTDNRAKLESCYHELERLGVPEPYFVVNPARNVCRDLQELLFGTEKTEGTEDADSNL